MKILKVTSILLLFLALSVLVSCGGGSNSDGGIEGTGISHGAITAKDSTANGSISVNGVEFDTSGADVTIDDNPGAESDLKQGMVVTVRGSINGTSGIAASVSSEDVVKGPVDFVAGDGSSMVVLGQTILVDNNTIIDDSIPGKDISVLPSGTLVEVHGFVKDNGIIGATFIELKLELLEFRVKGFVENRDITNKTFTIGLLTINYNTAIVDNLPGGDPENNQLVEVKGENPLVDGVLIATKVEPEGPDVADAPDTEVEGFITSVDQVFPTADFVVERYHVITTNSTLFSGGLQEEIAVGLKVEVEGTLADDILTADKVKFKDSIRLESDVDSVDLGNNELTLEGLGIIVQVVIGQTEFKGGASSLSDFDANFHVRVRGRPSGTSNTVIASELELRSSSPDPDVVLQGLVDSVTNPTLSIFGISVNTNDILDDNNFEGLDDMPIGRAAFFATVQPGDLVKAQGDLDNLSVITITWDEIELED